MDETLIEILKIGLGLGTLSAALWTVRTSKKNATLTAEVARELEDVKTKAATELAEAADLARTAQWAREQQTTAAQDFNALAADLQLRTGNAGKLQRANPESKGNAPQGEWDQHHAELQVLREIRSRIPELTQQLERLSTLADATVRTQGRELITYLDEELVKLIEDPRYVYDVDKGDALLEASFAAARNDILGKPTAAIVKRGD